MPKSKVRKKVKARRTSTEPEELVLMMPVWEYRKAAKGGSTRTGKTEEEVLQALLAMPIRVQYPGEPRPKYIAPAAMASAAEVSLDEWLGGFTVIHEIGGLEWDDELKAHIFTTPPSAT